MSDTQLSMSMFARKEDYWRARCEEVERENADLRAKLERKDAVVLALKRVEGYEDVHPQLLAEDAMRDWVEYEILSPVDAAIAQGKGQDVPVEREG